MKKLLLISALTASFNFSYTQSMKQTNKHFSNTLETTATASEIWEIWTDVPNWKNWDIGLKDASLAGNFTLKAKGKILSLEGKKSNFKIVAYEKGKSYTFKTNLPFGGVYVKRYLSLKNGKVFFTHEVWFSGLAGGVFAKRFGPNFKKMLPTAMQNIKEIAEK